MVTLNRLRSEATKLRTSVDKGRNPFSTLGIAVNLLLLIVTHLEQTHGDED